MWVIFLVAHQVSLPRSKIKGTCNSEWWSGPKWLKSGPVAENQPAEQPNGHLTENQSYPELPQDMGTYDPIESGPSEPKENGGFIGVV